MNKGLKTILAELANRFERVRSGLDIGFNDPAVTAEFNALRPGVWMATDAELPLPFEDAQFEAVIVESSAVSRDMAKEVHRILKGQGCMFFTVDERRGANEPGYTAPEVYKLVRDGFDIISLVKPKWWYFGLKGHNFTVCAKKKAWKEVKRLFGSEICEFTPFRGKVG